jgi:hypothetical protein
VTVSISEITAPFRSVSYDWRWLEDCWRSFHVSEQFWRNLTEGAFYFPEISCLCRFCSNSLDTCSEALYKGFCMNFTPQLVLKLRPSLPLDLDVLDVCHCLPIFALLPRSVMKNCEPFVSGPVLAMDSSIGLEWRTTWRSWNVHFWNEPNPNNILLKSS